MREEIWFLLALTAAFLALLTAFALRAPQDGRLYRVCQRTFWAGALLWASGALGGVGLSAVTLTATAALGLPGYAALTALWLL